MSMNRPHVAALLRKIADEAEADVLALPISAQREIAPLIEDVAERLRVRAGEIEAGG